MTKKIFMLLAAVLLSSANLFAQSNEPLKGDVNEDGMVDVADVVAVIDIIAKSQNDSETTYYWYIGQTDPSTMSSISTAGTDFNAGGGWTSTGNSVPDQINQLVKGGDSTKNWYSAVPITSPTTLKPVASDMTTIDTSVEPMSTKVFDNVTYQIYRYTATARKSVFFAKK